MTARWYPKSLLNARDFCPNAAHLSDQEYVCGMLRVVISSYYDEDTAALQTMVLEVERGSLPLRQAVTQTALRRSQVRRVLEAADALFRNTPCSTNYRTLSGFLDSILRVPGDHYGIAWVRAVNSLVDPAA